MRLIPGRHVVCMVALLSVWLGCGAPSPNSDTEVDASRVAGAPELPELDDYYPSLDEGRIEVAPPKGWHRPPRSSKYVLRIQKSAKSKYPSVVITAEEYAGEGIVHVTSENVETFADQMAVALKKDRSDIEPTRIGDFVGIAYRRRGREAKSISRILELLYLDTVVAGRKYSIELRCEDGSLEQDQAYLHAVVKGIRFLESEAQQGETRPEAEKKQEPEEEAPQTPQKQAEAKPETPKKEPKTKLDKEGDIELDLDKLDELLKE